MMLGLGGNVTAAKAVLDHTCGREPDAPADGAPLNVTLPKLTTAASCTAAIDDNRHLDAMLWRALATFGVDDRERQ